MPFSKNCISWNKGKHLLEETKKKIGEANKISMKGNKNGLGNIPWNKGKNHSEETKRKIGLASIGNKYCLGFHHSDETKRKMSESKRGEKNQFYGKCHSVESKRKMSESHKGQIPPNKGKHPTEETRRKLRENHADFKGEKNPNYGTHPIVSEETKKKLSKASKGENNYWYGKHLSENHKKLLSEWHKGQHPSIETRKKMSEARKGKSFSEEHRKKLSDSKKGNKNFNYGKVFSEEYRKKIGLAGIGRYVSEETRRKIGETNREHLRNILVKRPTKPQLKLFEVIKMKYPVNKIMMDYSIKTNKGYRFIDVAIPELRLGFEYDEPYWHQNKERDLQRHSLIESEGWKLTHFRDVSEFLGM
jgi:hypothetical protein